ncbi:hypothetical protein NpPPO83_00008869 [Neofusicoccum parvum]|uniref:Uncharacterized protein n=1 Tax=Neofusicoccum parvum TaxID=310453 RepID=A0ACB5S167_9PEZI|nr:hypothetical protein NpPPO83_00008869 [Neofusicoccum parvum]
MPPLNLARRFNGRSDIADAFPLKPIHFEHAHDINMEPAGSAADASCTMHSKRKITLDDLWNTEVNQKPEVNDNSRKGNSSKKNWEYEYKYSSRSIPPAPHGLSAPMHRRHYHSSRSPTPHRRPLTPDRRRSRSPTPGRRRFRSPDRRSRSYSDYRLTHSKNYRGEHRPHPEAYDDLGSDHRRSARYRSPSPRGSYTHLSDRRADSDRRDVYNRHDAYHQHRDHSSRNAFPRRGVSSHLHNHQPRRPTDTRANDGRNLRENRARSDPNGTSHAAPRPHRPGYFHGAPASPPRRRGSGYTGDARAVRSGGRCRRADERGWPVRGTAGRGGGEGAFLGRHFVTRR